MTEPELNSPLSTDPADIGNGFNETFSLWEPQHRTRVNSLAASLFCQLKLIGELRDWPECIPDLKPHQAGLLRFVANTLDVASRMR